MFANDAYTGTITNAATQEESVLYTAVQNDISGEAEKTGLTLNKAYHTHVHTERQADSEEDDYAAIDQVQEEMYDYVDPSMMDIKL